MFKVEAVGANLMGRTSVELQAISDKAGEERFRKLRTLALYEETDSRAVNLGTGRMHGTLLQMAVRREEEYRSRMNFYAEARAWGERMAQSL
jgi:hypothetical protein